MKISTEDFKAIEAACMDTLKAHNLHSFMVNSTARMWEVFHKASYENRINLNDLYKRYNDSHIETALRKIFKQ